MNSGLLKIDKTWSLFLDRDGVINNRIVGGYVHSWDQFEFLPGVLDALKLLTGNFNKIFIVSNQQGVGKGLMTDNDVKALHSRMAEEIVKAGGNITKIYYSPSLEQENSIMRKPNIGMALKARKEFPGINFKRSMMVGDSISDMIFGKRLKMKTVLLSQDIFLIRKGADVIDFVCDDLLSFTNYLSISSSPPDFLTSSPSEFLPSSPPDFLTSCLPHLLTSSPPDFLILLNKPSP